MKDNGYSRRSFIRLSSYAGLTLAGTAVTGGLPGASAMPAQDGPDIIQGLDLQELHESYSEALFSQFLPNMDRYVIDHEYGGFMTTVDIRSGKQLSTDKRAWYEGRGIWVYSFLYNNLKKDPGYLEIARKSKDFIMKHRPSGQGFWESSFDRQGRPLSVPGDKNPYIVAKGDIYGNLFIAEGLVEYAKASGEREYLEIAKKITLDCLAAYDNPDYFFDINYGPSAAPKIRGTRVLGHWMVFLRTATQMLEQGADPDIEKLAGRCVDAVMNHHLNTGYNLLNEGLEHDLRLPDNEWSQFAYLGHGIETLWMVMFEAVRLRDKKLLLASAEAFKRHVNVAQDLVYGGFFRSLDHVDENKWTLNKMLLFQEEVLIGTLFLAEHTGDPWACRCFNETYRYVREKFTRPGYKFWIADGDRRVSGYNAERAEHYHHPRHLMLNLLAVDRMIKRRGKVSGLLNELQNPQ